MKMKSGIWLLAGFGGLLLVAFLIASFAPTAMPAPDMDVVRTSPMPLIVDTSGVRHSSLPILAERMPEFQGITHWWNTEENRPLTPEDLKGKVVFLDFWTYSCINCIRTQPFLRKMWETYKDDGLVIIGVHTPEFAFEKVPKNVEKAFTKAGLEYPLALDPNYETWNAYRNRYWPAGYFFDRQGRLRFTHFGEGQYAEQEEVIRELLADGTTLTDAPTGVDPSPDFATIVTHETYFGSERMDHLANLDEFKASAPSMYRLREPQADEWSVGGEWKFENEYAASLQTGNRFRMNVQANAMHIVFGSMNGTKRVRVLVDGKDPTDEQLADDAKRQADGRAVITITGKDLYRIARFPEANRHTVELEFLDAGVELYASTFGE
jgi:thiol-disulfide isomerase/thioredoxin